MKRTQAETQVSSGIVRRNMLLKSFTLSDQSSFQDNAAFLVALAVFSSKFIDPTQFAVAVLAAHISNHVAASEHDPILNFTVLQIYHLTHTYRGQGIERISLPEANLENNRRECQHFDSSLWYCVWTENWSRIVCGPWKSPPWESLCF